MSFATSTYSRRSQNDQHRTIELTSASKTLQVKVLLSSSRFAGPKRQLVPSSAPIPPRSFGEETLRGTKSQKSAKNLAESIDRSPVEAISDWPDDILIRGRSYHANFSRISAGTVWPNRVYRVTPHRSTESNIYIFVGVGRGSSWFTVARSRGHWVTALHYCGHRCFFETGYIQWSRFYFIPPRRGINSSLITITRREWNSNDGCSFLTLTFTLRYIIQENSFFQTRITFKRTI